MAFTGFRMDVSGMQKQVQKMHQSVVAEAFRPELLEFEQKALTWAVLQTPKRELGLIRSAQTKQYYNRTHFIPSVHTKDDPRLIIGVDGSQFLFSGGKWYRPDKWRLPPAADAQYHQLLVEMQRRQKTVEQSFIAARAQARFLYAKSFYQAGFSLGLSIRTSGEVRDAKTRRKPPEQPPKGYAQIRGGKWVLSVVIFNPFLDQPSDYKKFDWHTISAEAHEKYFPDFLKACGKKLNALLKNN